MSDTGVKYPATVSTTQESGDDNDWVSPGSVGADDGVYANIVAATFDTPDVSYLLRATNLSMGVPTDATILGIIVQIERYCDTGERCQDVDVCLTKNGTVRVGNDKSAGAIFSIGTPAAVSFGGVADPWNTTWTPAEINATTFGVLYKMGAVDANADGYVDFIRVTVYYTAPTTNYLSVSGIAGSLSGTLAKSTSKGLAGVAGSLVGSLTKSTSKSFSGAAGTLSGVLANARLKVLAVGGTMGTLVGSLGNIPTFVIGLGGTMGALSGAISKATSKSFSGQAGALSGSVSKSTGKQLGGATGGLSGSLGTSFTAIKGLSGTVGSLLGSLSNVFEAGSTAIKLSVGGAITSISGGLLIYKLSLSDHVKVIWRNIRSIK